MWVEIVFQKHRYKKYGFIPTLDIPSISVNGRICGQYLAKCFIEESMLLYLTSKFLVFI